jgi:methanogenic corrinoid protein MtbC1
LEIKVLIRTEQDLIESKGEIADAIKLRLGEKLFQCDGNERLRMVFDLQTHLGFLGEAVRCNVPHIFIEYALWTHELLVTCGGVSQHFKDCLLAIRAEIQASGSGDWTQTAIYYLEDALNQLEVQRPISKSYLSAENPDNPLAETFLNECLNLNRNEVLEAVQTAVNGGVPVADIYQYVITPVMHELGRMWHLNQITIGQEHYCTAVAQMVMSQLFPWIFDGNLKKKRLVSTCVAGELHEIGARMVSDLFEMNGWDTVFIGADVPIESVIDTLVQHNADVLAISATLGCNLSAVSNMIAMVKQHPACKKIKVLVGGAALNIDSSLWQRLGADGWAEDARTAIALANSWCIRS